MPESDLYVSTARFFRSGEPIPVPQGSVARKGHPILAEAPHLWRPITVDFEVEPELTEREQLDQLRPEAVQLGINVDGRWTAARLRKEIDKAKAREAEMEAGG